MKMLRDLKIFIRAHLWLIPVIALVVGLFLWALDPAPPTRLSMATGAPGGAYQAFGERLKKRLAQDDVTLDLVESNGSLDNLKRLQNRDQPIQLALVQSGTERMLSAKERRQLHSLGAMYREPLWLVQRSGLESTDLRSLQGKRVAIGGDGSGTLAVVDGLLQAEGIRHDDWQKIGGQQAVDALERGDLDAAFFVGPPENPFIRTLASSRQLRVVGIDRTAALEAHFPFLTAVKVPQGLLDLPNDSPDTDIVTLSPVATLVANSSLHPALTPLVIEAARDVLKEGTLIDAAGQFPSAQPSTFDLTKEADNYYRNGPPYLQRYLPFKIASLVDRYIVLLIPFIAILLPLFKSLSPLYKWRIRSRIYKWYKDLRDVDEKILDGSIHQHLPETIDRLRGVENELGQVEVPLSYASELYALHLHVRYQLNRLLAIRDGEDPTRLDQVDPVV